MMNVSRNVVGVVARLVSFCGFGKLAAAICLSLLCCVQMATAALVPTVIFSEDFTTTPAPAKFAFSGGGTSSVGSGILTLTKPVSTNPLYLSNTTFTTDNTFTVETDLGTYATLPYDPSNETYGLVIGNRSFGTFMGGAPLFNVVNLGSGITFGYDGMGFSSVGDGTLHHLKVDVDRVINSPNTKFTFTFTNTVTSQTYTNSYVDTSWVPGGVGYFSAFSGSANGSFGVFDNLQVIALREEVPPAPEPAAGVLLSMGLLGLASMRRRRRAG